MDLVLEVDFLPRIAFAFMLLFARIGTVIMIMPVIGDRVVPVRVRLVFTLTIVVLLYPLLESNFPLHLGSFFYMLKFLVLEIAIGFCIGNVSRLVTSSLQVAGSFISVQVGLSFVQNVNPAQFIQSDLFSNFLWMLGITLILLLDLHHLMLAALRDSYYLFPAGILFPFSDFVEMAVDILTGIFILGLRISAPFLAFSLIFYISMGVLSRLMPQVQVFFIALPLNIIAGFLLFIFLITAIMSEFLTYFEIIMGQLLT
ncbi:MAG: flagellar biosynthetic protein FliR [Alphaproteobacteria bacterium]|nr:flagellar biosynthetic protein FliR [Alphaproteobacteria bacterium]